MADISLSYDELSQILECPICLEVIEEPKKLVCDHNYCKRCLDGLLSFHPNGTATIKCPKGCPELTKISKNETTKSLRGDYMLKKILDKMTTTAKSDSKSGEENPVKCEPNGKCVREINAYCYKHATFVCKHCTPEHDRACQFTPIRYDGLDDQYYIRCDEHDTDAGFICCDDEYLCTYCINRHHKGHMHDTIRTQAAQLREMLSEEIEQLKTISGGMEIKRKETEDEIVKSKERLDKMLRARKLKCMAEYYDYMSEEEERLKNKFEAIASHHLEKSFIIDPTEEYKKQLKKTNVELVLQKVTLMSSMNDLQMKKMKSVKELTITFEKSDFSSQYPLGNLRTMYGEVGTFNKVKKSFSTKFKISEDDVISDDKLLNNLKYFCRETLDYEEEVDEEGRSSNSRPVFMRQMGVNESFTSDRSADCSFRSLSSISDRSCDESTTTKKSRNNSKNKHKSRTQSSSPSSSITSDSSIKCSSKTKPQKEKLCYY